MILSEILQQGHKKRNACAELGIGGEEKRREGGLVKLTAPSQLSNVLNELPGSASVNMRLSAAARKIPTDEVKFGFLSRISKTFGDEGSVHHTY